MRTLIVSQVERAVRDPTDQVITTIRLEIAQSSHARIIAYSTTTPPLLHHHWGQHLEPFVNCQRQAKRLILLF